MAMIPSMTAVPPRAATVIPTIWGFVNFGDSVGGATGAVVWDSAGGCVFTGAVTGATPVDVTRLEEDVEVEVDEPVEVAERVDVTEVELCWEVDCVVEGGWSRTELDWNSKVAEITVWVFDFAPGSLLHIVYAELKPVPILC
jgi:hypothetical protein